MGLRCSHGAFKGAYGAFNRFRQGVARACGGSFPPHEDPNLHPDLWYWDGDLFSSTTHPGLYAFFCHSDAHGELTTAECAALANEMSALLPKIASFDGEDWGHIERAGGLAAVAERFIAGCLAAVAANEPLEFR